MIGDNRPPRALKNKWNIIEKGFAFISGAAVANKYSPYIRT